MFADGIKHAAHIDQTLSVQLQRFHGSPADRGQPYDSQRIFTPGKVFVSPLLARMIERNQKSGDRIEGRRFSRLMTITPLAALGEVFDDCQTTGFSRNDVIYWRRLRRVTSRIATILTAVPRPLDDQAAQLGGDVFFSHDQGTECLIDSLPHPT